MKDVGDGDVDVRVIDGNGKKVFVDIIDNKDGIYLVVYYFIIVGVYIVNIIFNFESIFKSFFWVNVCQINFKVCCVYGLGLEKGFVNQNNEFKIEMKGVGEGGLGLIIEGFFEVQIECKDNGDGLCDVIYLFLDFGDYVINILFVDEYIFGSFFKVRILYLFDFIKVKVEGLGIEFGVCVGELVDIDIDICLVGDVEFIVEVVDELNSLVQCDIDEEEYGIYVVMYYLKKKGMVFFLVNLCLYKMN